MLTGGEPLVRKADVSAWPKSTATPNLPSTPIHLIDEAFCAELVRLGNIIPLLSHRGTPETNDAAGETAIYAAVMHAMDLLKAHGIPFGTSICYTRANVEAVTSDDFSG